MKVNIKTRGVKLSEDQKTMMTQKLAVLDEKFADPQDVEAIVHVSKYLAGYKIEVTIPTETFVLRSEEKGMSMSVLMTALVGKLSTQIEKYRLSFVRQAQSDTFTFRFGELRGQEDLEKVEISRRKSVSLVPVSEEQAIIEMEMSEHDFYVYEDINTHKVNVVYKRHAGGYGILESDKEVKD